MCRMALSDAKGDVDVDDQGHDLVYQHSHTVDHVDACAVQDGTV